jgi:Na+/melibiose symporter-like transporter
MAAVEEKLGWDQRRFLALLGLPSFALALAVTMVTTYLPVFLEKLTGPALTGLLIGSEGLLALFVPLLVGTGSDRTRTRLGARVPYMIAATPVAVGALVLMPLVGSLVALVLLLLLFYTAYFAYYSPYYALYPDLVPESERGRSQGFQNTLRELGLGGALVGGGVLLGLWRPLPFLIAALILASVTAAFVLRLREPEQDEPAPEDDEEGPGTIERVRELVAGNPDLRRTAYAVALWEAALAALKTFVVLFFTVGLGRSMGFASAVLAVVAVAVVAAAVLGGKFADRLGHRRLVGVSVWVYAVGLAVPAFWHTPGALAIVPVVAFAAGVVMTLSYAMMMDLMPDGGHGASSGLYGFARGSGVLAGPVIAGVAITLARPLFESTEGYAAVFLVASAAVFASIPVLALARRSSAAAAR